MENLTVSDLKLSIENLALLTGLTGNANIRNTEAGAAFNEACRLSQNSTDDKVIRLPGVIALGISLRRSGI